MGTPAKVLVDRGAASGPGQISLNAMPLIEAAAVKSGSFGPVSLGGQLLEIGTGGGEGQGSAGPAEPVYGSTLADDAPRHGLSDQNGRAGKGPMDRDPQWSPSRSGPERQAQSTPDPVGRPDSPGTQASTGQTARAERAAVPTPGGQEADIPEAPGAVSSSPGRTGPEAVVPGPHGGDVSNPAGTKAEVVQPHESLADRQGVLPKGPDSVGLEAAGLRDAIGPKGGPTLFDAGASKSGQEAALRDEILHQVADRARILTEDGGGSARIKLRPASLGSMRLEITVRDGVVSARIITDNPATRGLIEASSAELRDALQAQDLKIEKFGVFVGREGPGGQTALFDSRSENRGNGPEKWGQPAPSPEWTGAGEDEIPSTPRRPDGLIDLLA